MAVVQRAGSEGSLLARYSKSWIAWFLGVRLDGPPKIFRPATNRFLGASPKRSAISQESHVPGHAQFFVGWGTLTLINAGLAQAKGRSGLLWWLLSLFLGPIATFFIVVLPKV